MNENHRYFKVNGGPVREIHDIFMAERQIQLEARNAFAEEFGAVDTYGNESQIAGLQFEGARLREIPSLGWKKIAGQLDVFRPPAGKAWKEIRNRMAKLGLIGRSTLHHRLVGGIGVFGKASPGVSGFAIRYIFPELIGDVLILQAPEGFKWDPLPEFVEEIKTSAYWLLKEAHVERGTA